MDVKEAIAAAKAYVYDIYADEKVADLRVEEIEHLLTAGNWVITLAFSHTGTAPRTRAQEVLENLGALNTTRDHKVLTISDDGTVLSMKNRPRVSAA